MKGISLITKGKNTCEALTNQLYDLLGEEAHVKGYYLDGGIQSTITDDLIVISSADIYEEALKYIDKNCPVIQAHRTINYHEIGKLLNIPPGTDVLFVNDLASTTFQTIAALKALGIDHINYFPYFPGMRKIPELSIAVTPGELQIVPRFVERVIDIKTRNIDLVTIVEIYKTLGLPDEKAVLISAKYIKDIIELIKTANAMADTNNRIKNQLQTIINSVHDGIIAVDEKDRITVFNPVAEKIFCCSWEDALGKNYKTDFTNASIPSALETSPGEEEKFTRVNESYVVINSSSIEKDNYPIGKVYTIKDVTEIQRLEEELRRKLVTQENHARYTFNHITGSSRVIADTKELAKKIAGSDSPVLIFGESGTGKELFAQAIHNASRRRNYPFIAVNFAALPESLLESELFGYEEGAFTGAKKGGMAGLFEQAHGGTIFLDEIGDSPVSFQIRLLRVLQEKQVRRIGSSKVIPIDVRVISATNRDLKALIEKGSFRQDLFYRLNVLPLKIPPLRRRKEDIMSIATVFYNELFRGRPPVKAEKYFRDIKEPLMEYEWPGNIRELRNVIEYLANICPDGSPSPEMLTEELKEAAGRISRYDKEGEEALINEMLEQIFNANIKKQPVGRRTLSRKLRLPESRVRRLIGCMAREGLITVNRGVKGLQLTDKGRSIIV